MSITRIELVDEGVEDLPVCEGVCTVAEFKQKLIPHAEVGIAQPFSLGVSEFVYKGKYQADYL